MVLSAWWWWEKVMGCCFANVAATRDVCARYEMAMMALLSIVRRPVTASASLRQHAVCVSNGLSQAMNFQNQQINLGLLPHDDLVQLFKQVVGITGFDFEGVQALVGVVGMVDGHGAIGYRIGVSPLSGCWLVCGSAGSGTWRAPLARVLRSACSASVHNNASADGSGRGRRLW